MFDRLIRGLLLCSLFVFIPTRIDGDELFCLLLYTVTIFIGFFVKPKRNVGLLIPIVIFLYALINSYFHLQENQYSAIRHSLANYFTALVCMKVVADRWSGSVKSIGVCFIFYMLANFVLVVLHSNDIWFLVHPMYFENQITGFSFRPWALGCTMVMIAPFIYSVFPWALLLTIPSIINSTASSCALAAVIVVMVCLYKTRKKLIMWGALVTVPLMAFYVYVIDKGPQPERFVAWKNSLKYLDNWWLGEGLGTWAHQGFVDVTKDKLYHWQWAHNELFQLFHELGVVCTALFLFWYLKLFFQLKDYYLKAFLAGFGVICLFHPVMHFGKFTYLGVIALAICVASRHDDSAPRSFYTAR